jgi:hypothetical protein
MDDFNVSNLYESKNEWVSRLVNVLTPLIIQGIQSIFTESWNLCEENDEIEKYLMTFQNLLSRVPKWNDTIVGNEVKRIIESSGCTYLTDLITCVHIIQLKILTSIRVGKTQKKVNIEIPQLNEFIHNVYINTSRKLYTNIYLYEKNIKPLQYQKNHREIEMIVKEAILNTVRENIPVEAILKTYLDETEEDEIIEETEEIIERPKTEEEKQAEEEAAEKARKAEEEKEMETTPNIQVSKSDSTVSVDTQTGSDESSKTLSMEGTSENNNAISANVATELSNSVIKKETGSTPKIGLNTAISIPTSEAPKSEADTENASSLSFNNIDSAIGINKKVEELTAPKDIDTLEEISEMRNTQRKMEEALEDEADEDDSIKIHDSSVSLGGLDVQDLTKPLETKPDPVLTDVEVLL